MQAGHPDVVVELGRDLWKMGNEQVEQSDDEGDTAGEIGKCMDIVFQAVMSSTLSRSEQLLWMMDIFLEDQFSIIDAGESFIRSKTYDRDDWQAVADSLRKRLDAVTVSGAGGYSDRYKREAVMNRLIDALERSGRREEIIPLLEKEAHATYCYGKLVDAFLQAGNHEKAREWCIEGFRKTVKNASGIAWYLQKKLRELAGQEKKFDLVAAYRAQDFFERPSRDNYIDLKNAAEKVDCWPSIRMAALSFLSNGRRPDLPGTGGRKQAWPLPTPEVVAESGGKFPGHYPDLNVLIDIAIFEKRFDDVVQLYQEQQSGSRRGIGKGGEVAAAVSATHPDIALAIWKKIAEGQIRLVKPKAYEEAAISLRKMHGVYRKTKRLDEWRNLIRSLRTEHRQKRRLLEVLDSLESKRIID